MKTFPKNKRILIVSLLALLSCLSVPRPAYGQTEKLGMVAYTPPRGWNKTLKENVVGFSRLDQTAGTFCIITPLWRDAGNGQPGRRFFAGLEQICRLNNESRSGSENGNAGR